MARREFDIGEAPDGLGLGRMIMVLKRSPEREAALQQLLQDQQDIHSDSYHRWLTPEQFGEQFGPAATDLDTVTQWLAGRGFQVSQVSKSRMFIEFSGSASQVKQAFRAPIHSFVVNGEQHWANAANPSIPAALAPVVAGIDSLHNFLKQAQHVSSGAHVSPGGWISAAAPDYTIFDGAGNPSKYALGPYDFAAIYDLLPLWTATPTPITGAGQTISIVGRSDINPADTIYFWSSFGLDGVHGPEPALVVTYNGPNPGITGDESEGDIDTQWSGAVAPGATINYVVSESTISTDGVDLSALYIVDNNLGSSMSESYGECEASLGASGVQFYGSLWEQAAAQGISVFVSSGDSGAAGCDNPRLPAKGGLQVNGIASTPYNAAVGGTDFNQYENWASYWNPTNSAITNQSAKGYIPETTWNDSCTNQILQLVSGGSNSAETNCNNSGFAGELTSTGGGGGSSSSWLKPVWQTGTPSDNARDLPDVSLFAGNGFLNSYYYICRSDTQKGGCLATGYLGFGGTSVASPQFAGIMALINQKTGSAQGVPGLILYKLASQEPAAFHDIPAGSTISVPCLTGSPNCTTTKAGDAYGVLSGYSTATGYDLATGLGSVDVAKFVNEWQSVSFTASVTTLAMNSGSAVNITHGTSVPFSANVTPSAATGEVALMVAPGTPGDAGIGSFPISSGTVAASTASLPGGSYRVLAHYGGDKSFGGSYSNSVPVTVSPEASATFANLLTTDVNGVPSSYVTPSTTYGAGYQFFHLDVGEAAASVSPAKGIASQCSAQKENCPTGTVKLSVPGTILDGMTLGLNSKGYAEVPSLPAGTYSGSASYSGDASYGPSVGNVAFTIAKAPTTVEAAATGFPIPYGNQQSIDAQVLTTSDGIAPTGTFQMLVDGSPILQPLSVYESGGYNGVANGKPNYAWADAQSVYNFLNIGNHTISAQYSGDVNYAAGTAPPTAISVVQATPLIFNYGIPNPGGNPIVVGESLTASATVFPLGKGLAPTGTVTMTDGGVNVPVTFSYSTVNNMTNNTLVATGPVTFTTTGTHTISFSYSGDANYTSAFSSTTDSVNVEGMVDVSTGGLWIDINSPGQSGTVPLSITPNGSFTGMATLTCTNDVNITEATCGFVSGASTVPSVQVNVTATGASATLSVSTTGPHTVAKQETPGFGGLAGLALAGLLPLFLPRFRRLQRHGLLLVLLCITLALGSCGGGGSSGSGGGGGGGGGGSTTDPGTAIGTYTFKVTATTGTGSSAITSTFPVTVSVQ